MAQNLCDSTGTLISTEKKWYKIQLGDGRELGWCASNQGLSTCGPVPAGEGAVFRYMGPHGDDDEDYVWPEKTRGYLKALSLGYSGENIKGFLALSKQVPPLLEFCAEVTGSEGFQARSAPGNRILLLAQKGTGTMSLRVKSGSGTGDVAVVRGGTGVWATTEIPLDCQFVPCGPISWWDF